MKQKIIDILIFIAGIITAPIWVAFVIIILFKIPKDYYKIIEKHPLN